MKRMSDRDTEKQALLGLTKVELSEMLVKAWDAYELQKDLLQFYKERSLDDNEKVKRVAEKLAQLSLPLEIAKARTVQTTAAARKSVEKRPASRAKREVEVIYREWVLTGKFLRHSKAEFSRKMVKKFNTQITSERTVLNWCRAWDKEK
jgi:hypothetical protein